MGNLRESHFILQNGRHRFAKTIDFVLNFVIFPGFNEDKVNELIILREQRMFEDIKDAIEKRRDLEIKDMQGATAVGFHSNKL